MIQVLRHPRNARRPPSGSAELSAGRVDAGGEQTPALQASRHRRQTSKALKNL